MDPSYDRLTALLGEMKSVLVAFSGGVDSTLLLAAARDALGENVLAVTASSPTYSEGERARAIDLAARLGARHRIIETAEFDDPAFRANPPERCYHCKRALFAELCALAEREGLAFVIDGENADDRQDYRPGSRAARELDVRSPLAELHLSKDAIRRLARDRGLPNWNDPACACLASRIPYGEEIDPRRLARIAAAETAIRALGFRVVRVRDHGPLARVEIGADEMAAALDPRMCDAIAAACREQGFLYATLDLEGYRTGSMNASLSAEERESGAEHEPDGPDR